MGITPSAKFTRDQVIRALQTAPWDWPPTAGRWDPDWCYVCQQRSPRLPLPVLDLCTGFGIDSADFGTYVCQECADILCPLPRGWRMSAPQSEWRPPASPPKLRRWWRAAPLYDVRQAVRLCPSRRLYW